MNLPSRDLLTSHVVYSLKSYWPENSEKLLDLPIPNFQVNLKLSLPLQLEEIAMPAWATDLGIDGQLLVPKESVKSSSNQFNWEHVDWWLAIFLLLEGWHERHWEKAKGVIHSYSFKLKGWDKRAWEHAWVNRIALFLRKWLGIILNKTDKYLGPLPKARIFLSHDVDAVSKTMPIRLKQSAFNFFNFSRSLLNGNFHRSTKFLIKGVRFLFINEEWRFFEKLLKLEKEKGIKAVYNLCADPRKKDLKGWFMDPIYDISSPMIQKLCSKIIEGGHEIGIHPTYDCWKDGLLLKKQKVFLEKNVGIKINKCRQHWLRFSWKDTWMMQMKAGIQTDTTLAFNDRPGFRNSSCLTWEPWGTKNEKRLSFKCTNTTLMDSHLFDYNDLSSEERVKEINRLRGECNDVFGQCYFLWHPQTLSKDYDWEDTFFELIKNI